MQQDSLASTLVAIQKKMKSLHSRCRSTIPRARSIFPVAEKLKGHHHNMQHFYIQPTQIYVDCIHLLAAAWARSYMDSCQISKLHNESSFPVTGSL